MVQLDGGIVSSILIGAAGVIGWLYTQTQARSKAQRSELRWRRKMDLAKDRYLYRLEQKLSSIDVVLPDKPDDLIAAEGEEW